MSPLLDKLEIAHSHSCTIRHHSVEDVSAGYMGFPSRGRLVKGVSSLIAIMLR
jgi:hypothetical protein